MTDPHGGPPFATIAISYEDSGMAYGRSKLYEHGDVAEQGDVAAAVVSETSVRNLVESRREIATLRAINAQLVEQVALLRQREAHVQRLADRDGLTGLFNRRRMLELLDSTLFAASQQKHGVGLLFIDLDGFKGINDDFGHAAGDKLLVTVASRIAARARTGDFVCRYGGDEFVVILPCVDDVAAVHQVADSIRKRVALPYRIDGIDLQVAAAIGVSIYPEEADTAAGLLNRADESMYRVKAGGTDHSNFNGRAALPSRRRDDKVKRRPGA
jgi:diguanylate cyclase (GGDEF)-like protein